MGPSVFPQVETGIGRQSSIEIDFMRRLKLKALYNNTSMPKVSHLQRLEQQKSGSTV